MVISITMAALLIEADDRGMVTHAAVAVGACSVVARRLDSLELALRGNSISSALAAVVTQAHLAFLSPISDLRASAEYRLDIAATLIRRGLSEIVEGELR